MRVSCFECALRARGLFKPVTPTELSFINDIKRDHLTLPAGTEIIHADEDSPGLCHVRGFYLSIGRIALCPHVYISMP
jgi:hypothetical protein